MAFFPEIVTRHPGANLGMDGVESHLLQAGGQQLVFMSFDRDVEVPEHAHAAQWGVVLGGQMDLTVEGERRVLDRGDSYFIPAGARHSARIHRGYKDVTLFDQSDRYSPRMNDTVRP
jgi:quercetin dioxygenase-like cupin family protein